MYIYIYVEKERDRSMHILYYNRFLASSLGPGKRKAPARESPLACRNANLAETETEPARSRPQPVYNIGRMCKTDARLCASAGVETSQASFRSQPILCAAAPRQAWAARRRRRWQGPPRSAPRRAPRRPPDGAPGGPACRARASRPGWVPCSPWLAPLAWLASLPSSVAASLAAWFALAS